MPAEALGALLEPVWRGEHPLRTVYHPPRATDGARVVIARGYEVPVPMTAPVGDQTVTWTERRRVVRSLAWARRQAEHLEQRRRATVADIERLNERKQGKPRRTAEELRAAAEQIIQQRGVAGLLRLTVRTRTRQVRKRKYGARPEQEVQQTQSTIGARRDRAAVQAAQRRFGWRVYGTHHPTRPRPAVVLTYRGQYGIERGFGRFKGKALSLTPRLLRTDDRVIGWIRRLSLGLRVLTLLEFVVRRHLAKTRQTVAGLYAGQPKRPLARPTAEAILRAFKGISIARVQTGRQAQAMRRPLRPPLQRLLQRMGGPADVYGRLVNHFSKPALDLSET